MPAPSAHPASTSPSINWREHAIRLFRFSIVSGTGLALDLLLFMALIAAAVAPFVANMLSSAAAVTFVYAASVRRVFRHNGDLSRRCSPLTVMAASCDLFSDPKRSRAAVRTDRSCLGETPRLASPRR